MDEISPFTNSNYRLASGFISSTPRYRNSRYQNAISEMYGKPMKIFIGPKLT